MNPRASTIGIGKYKGKPFLWIAKNDPTYFLSLKTTVYHTFTKRERHAYQETSKILQGKKSSTKLEPQIEEVIGWIHEQKEHSWIQEQLREQGISNWQLQRIIQDARSRIEQNYYQERVLLIDLHCLRYEEIYYGHIAVDLSQVHVKFPHEKLEIDKNHKLVSLNSLFQKEKVLGIHTKGFKIKLNEYFEKKKLKEKKEYNFNALNLPELIEFKKLMSIAKVDLEQVVLPTLIDRGSIIEDTSFEEVKDTVRDFPIKKSIETDELKEMKAKIPEEPQTLGAIQEKLKNNALEELSKMLAKKRDKK